MWRARDQGRRGHLVGLRRGEGRRGPRPPGGAAADGRALRHGHLRPQLRGRGQCPHAHGRHLQPLAGDRGVSPHSRGARRPAHQRHRPERGAELLLPQPRRAPAAALHLHDQLRQRGDPRRARLRRLDARRGAHRHLPSLHGGGAERGDVPAGGGQGGAARQAHHRGQGRALGGGAACGGLAHRARWPAPTAPTTPCSGATASCAATTSTRWWTRRRPSPSARCLAAGAWRC